ncbi:hypothetical protein F5X99DRAFT_405736 [Biscogniauxia marginata]|nr:hypothetical protein F5X99DRAFT_405736 [Biscogniauxia marginata]
MRPAVILLGVGTSWLWSGVLGQMIRIDEPPTETIDVDGSTDTIDVDGATVASGGVEVPEEDEILLPSDPAPPPPPQEEEPEPLVPISAVLYSGAPGPKDCRGHAVMRVGLPKPGAQHASPQCYNLPAGVTAAQCAIFTANQDDGCQARMFNEPGCLTFMNVAVFTPEKKVMGGVVRSIEITCGVVSEAPPPLNLPGMVLPPGAQQAFGKAMNGATELGNWEVSRVK